MDDKKITEIVSQLLDGVHAISKSETIIGEPQRAGSAVIIPVHRLKIAFGAGAADANARGKRGDGDSGLQAAGGAVELDPVAAIAVSESGNAQLLAVDSDASTTWEALIAQVPEVINKVIHALGDRVTHKLEPSASAEALPEKAGGQG
jgi:uncharacterized spore protein YtfJ